MNKFNVGDKVRIAKSSEYYVENSDLNPKDVTGTVSEFRKTGNDFEYSVTWNEEIINCYRPTDLELVGSKPQFKVGYGAICIKKTVNHNVGAVMLIEHITPDGSLRFNGLEPLFMQSHFTPCPNPPLSHHKERIAYALGAEIECSGKGIDWDITREPQFKDFIQYRVAIPDIHAEEREKIKLEIEELQKRLESLGQ